MKKEPKDTTMTAREVAVLIEDLRSQFRIFGEQLKAVEESLETKIDGIAANQAATLERVTALEITVRGIKEKVTSLEITVSEMRKDIAEIKPTLKGHSERLSHLEALK